MQQTYNFIGKRVPKQDAPDKLMGRAVFINDVTLPGMLYGKIKRSEYAHAVIKHIDTSRAERLPGVKVVLTGKNSPAGNFRIGFIKDNPPLKSDKVRQYRDEVAAVAATDPDLAAEACELIKVDYEPLPGVFDPLEAQAKGAPLIHEYDFQGNPIKSNRLPVNWHIQDGDLDYFKRKSRHIVENTYRTGWAHHCCMGTTGIVADFDGRYNLTVHLPTQIPFLVQRDLHDLMTAMGLENRNIRVVSPTIGGAFGNKLDMHCYEYIAVLLARVAGRPVKIMFDREEEFIGMAPRQPTIITIAQGCDENGRLTFREARAVLDNGAYTSWGATVPSVMYVPMTSLYRVPAVDFQAVCVYTNNIFSQAFRGYGNPQATFAIESNLDELAREAGIDPLEMRLMNVNEANETTPMGLKVSSCGLRECFQAVQEKLDWNKPRRPNRGLGLAALIHVGGAARIYKSDGHGMMLKMDDFGKVSILTGAAEIGQGSETSIAQTVAEILGIHPDDVTVIRHDTAVCPWDVGTHASRQMFLSCKAAIICASQARKKILEYAAAFMEQEVVKKNRGNDNFDRRWLPLLHDPASFGLGDRHVFLKEQPDNKDYRVAIDVILRRAHYRGNKQGDIIMSQAFYEPDTEMMDPKTSKGNISETYAFAIHGVEVEVDPETGKVEILNYVAAHDSGRVLNPMLFEGQVYGGIMQGVGYALHEEMILNQGRILNPDFLDYRIPTMMDTFPLNIVTIETEDPHGPFGGKGIGEVGVISVAPAIANAIQDAAGIRLRDLPMGCEKVLEAIIRQDPVKNMPSQP
ncbi:MAG: xanthine dehydrogenase family protein molybdopterin-binding subunit [Deltaproteobacteria bacterium]|nr:MAG: xanthine dehydrogenase family protein molybdopterin-binding subunit [Deltaproteobacteria bacterium]